MSDLKRYFDEEMRHLQEAGREFAREHPESARMLAIDEIEDRDPYVERLFEGFAFLASRIRQTLDAEEDGIASHLLDLLAPGLDVPLPSVSMVEFTTGSAMGNDLVLPASAEVHSSVVPSLSRGARFVLAQTIRLQPGLVQGARFVFDDDGSGTLEFALEASGQGRFDLARPFDLYLHGDPGLVWTLQHWLTRRVHSVHVSRDGSGYAASSCGIVRSDESSPWVPAPAGAQSALLGMRDFLCADERFRFFRIEGLGGGDAANLRIRIRFQGAPPRFLERSVVAGSIRTNVAPMANAFVLPSEPIVLDHTLTEYSLRPQNGRGEEVLEVLGVKGVSQADNSRVHDYTRFSSYRHSGRKGPEAGYFEVHRRTNRSGAQKTSISVGHPDPDFAFQDEYLTIEARVSDGNHPREHLQPQDLGVPGPGLPTFLKCVGLVRPSAIFRPRELSEARWLLLGHMQRSFRGLAEAESLRDLLRTLLWDPREAKRTLIDRIQEVTTSSEYRLLDGVHWPVCRVTVRLVDETVATDSWERIGLLDAFAKQLGNLFAEEVPPGARLSFRLAIDPVGIELEHDL